MHSTLAPKYLEVRARDWARALLVGATMWMGKAMAGAMTLLLSSACFPYQQGSFARYGEGFPESRASRGCLDIGIRASRDAKAEGPVLDLYLGNHCNEQVMVDIGAMRVEVSLPDGERMPVAIYDPRDEIHPAALGGRLSAVERLELEAPMESLWVCAKLDRLTAGPQGGPPQQLCTEVVDA